MLSTFEIVATLAALDSVIVSKPPPRLIEALEACVVRVIVSASAPPISVSTLAIDPVFETSAKVSLSTPAPRSMLPLETIAAPRVMVSASVAARQGLDIRDRCDVGEIAENQLVDAVAEIDQALGEKRGDGDRIRRRAADDRFGVGHGGRVGEVAERQRIGCRAQINRAIRNLRLEGDCVDTGAAVDRLDASRAWPRWRSCRSVSDVRTSYPRLMTAFEAIASA